MKTKKLNAALSLVDDAFLDIAEQEKRNARPLWIRWTAIAAVLCVMIGAAWPLFHAGGSAKRNSATEEMAQAPAVGAASEQESFAVVQAAYPRMSPYPNEQDFIAKDGTFDSEGFQAQHDPWWQDRREMHTQPEGYSESLQNFSSRSFAPFLDGDDGENRVFSPVSVYMALAMLAQTTDGQTRQEILNLVGVDSSTLQQQARQVWRALYYNDGSTSDILANSLWLNQDAAYNRETIENLAQQLYASTFSGVMGSEEYDRALQSWINSQTGGLLQEYADMERMKPNTVLEIVSTVFFQCKWDSEFLREQNTVGEFRNADGSSAEAEFMNQSNVREYFWLDRFGAVARELKDGFRMWLILPDEGIAPEQLLEDAQLQQLLTQSETLTNRKWLRVNLSLPKFDIASRMDLKQGLQRMGITDAFEAAQADFTPLLPRAQGVYLDRVSHAARVAVDEQGVTAAAYTAMAECGAAMPPEEYVDFVLDRPFLFVITGAENLPVFAGIVNCIE